jgi:hypothetical protein
MPVRSSRVSIVGDRVFIRLRYWLTYCTTHIETYHYDVTHVYTIKLLKTALKICLVGILLTKYILNADTHTDTSYGMMSTLGYIDTTRRVWIVAATSHRHGLVLVYNTYTYKTHWLHLYMVYYLNNLNSYSWVRLHEVHNPTVFTLNDQGRSTYIHVMYDMSVCGAMTLHLLIPFVKRYLQPETE